MLYLAIVLAWIAIIFLLAQRKTMSIKIDGLRNELNEVKAYILQSSVVTKASAQEHTVATHESEHSDANFSIAMPEQIIEAVIPVESEPVIQTPLTATHSVTQPEVAKETIAPEPAKASEPYWIDKAVSSVKRYFTEGNLAVRIGIIILFIGVAFLLKYAADNNMLPMKLRLLACAVGGIALTVTGWLLRHKRRAYALILQGGGVGVLYLTIFATIRFFPLFDANIAFLLMVAVVAISCVLAVKQDAHSLAIFAILGGFLAPILASTGSGSHVKLFTYYVLLNIGIFSMAWFKRWRLLNLLGFLSTFVIATVWGILSYSPDKFATVEPFLIIFFLLYVGIAILFATRTAPRLKNYIDGTIVFGTPFICLGLQGYLVNDFEHGMTWTCLVAGVFYAILAWIVKTKFAADRANLGTAFTAISILLLTLMIPYALGEQWTIAIWAIEAACIVWISIKQKQRLGLAFSLLLLIIASIATPILAAFNYSDNYWLAYLCIIGSSCFISYSFSKYILNPKAYEYWMIFPLLINAGLFWLFGGMVEIHDLVGKPYEVTVFILYAAVTAAILGYLLHKLSWKQIAVTSLAYVILLASVFVTVMESNVGIFNDYRWFGWMLGFVVYAYLLHQNKQADNRGILATLTHIGGTLFWLGLSSYTIAWWMDQRLFVAESWTLLAIAILLSSAMWLFARCQQWPMKSFPRLYRGVVAYPIAAFLGLAILLVNFLFPGDSSPLPYIPLLNPLDIAIAISFAGLLYWWKKAYQYHDEVKESASVVKVIMAGLVFVWATAILIRTLHHYVGIEFDPDVLFNSIIVQMSLSVFWATLSVIGMFYSSRKAQRLLWITSAVLMGVVLLKMFAIDLSGSNTIGRIVSFIVVGLLLLIVGYFSPLPPKATSSK